MVAAGIHMDVRGVREHTISAGVSRTGPWPIPSNGNLTDDNISCLPEYALWRSKPLVQNLAFRVLKGQSGSSIGERLLKKFLNLAPSSERH